MVHIAQEVAVVNPHVGAGLDADGITVLCEHFLDREVADDHIRLRACSVRVPVDCLWIACRSNLQVFKATLIAGGVRLG